jgi:A/G-specific adenine glycosylase
MIISNTKKKAFHKCLLEWFGEHKRDFPWRNQKDPYNVLVSEVFLQKTDAAKALPAYRTFIRKYPSAARLKAANKADLMTIIKKIGLLYRVDRLSSIGKTLTDKYAGNVPADIKELLSFDGLGKYGASAVLCFAFNKREPIVDGNVVRIFERIFGFKSLKGRSRDDASLWAFAKSLLPTKNARDYNYALLDFSALQCTAKKVDHEACPLKTICAYYQNTKKSAPVGIDLFAGAGGLSLGFEQAGFNIRYAIENDKHAAETYKRNREHNKDLIVDTRNISDIKPKEILKKLGLKKGELDIVIGGPPCQGFSTSNMRTRNLANPQNQLVFKFIEFVNALKPEWFLMENVAGLASLDDGTFRDLLTKEFKNIGYSAESMVLNAVNFGVPQSRNRVFFIGNRLGINMDFISQLGMRKIRTPITVYETICDLPHLVNGNKRNEMEYRKRATRLSPYQKKMRRGMNGKAEYVNDFETLPVRI